MSAQAKNQDAHNEAFEHNRIEFPDRIEPCLNLDRQGWHQAVDATGWIDVRSPYNGAKVARVPVSGPQAVDRVVRGAAKAAQSWGQTPIKERTVPLFRFRDLLMQHDAELSQLVSRESGKTLNEARAGIHKGIEVIEFALSMQNLDGGGALEVSRGVTCETRRLPLGVVAGIVPFNFPAMVPLWMFPIAITAGNAFVLKPSEKVPSAARRMGELMLQAGYPPGVFSLVHGDQHSASALANHPKVQALAFVGSTPAARSVYSQAAKSGKRALCLGGAKNHLILAPDADPLVAEGGIVASFTGCAGQRCMAGSLLVAVSDGDNQNKIDRMIQGIVEKARGLRVGIDIGAVIHQQAVERLRAAIAGAEARGAKILLDGRKFTPPEAYAKGSWLGPTIIDGIDAADECAISELFGPVLSIVRVKNIEEALALEVKNPYGNATSVFTTSGAVARRVADGASAGMIGVNIGVPVPREPFSFGGTKQSRFGHGDITGTQGLDFWTQTQKITSKWQMQSDANWMS